MLADTQPKSLSMPLEETKENRKGVEKASVIESKSVKGHSKSVIPPMSFESFYPDTSSSEEGK